MFSTGPGSGLIKRVIKLHCLSYKVKHTGGCTAYTFSFVPSFVAKTQNYALQEACFDKFTIPSLEDFVDRERDVALCNHSS